MMDAERCGIDGGTLARAVRTRHEGEAPIGRQLQRAAASIDRLAWLLMGRLPMVDADGAAEVAAALRAAETDHNFDGVLALAEGCEALDQQRARQEPDGAARLFKRALLFWELGDLVSAVADATSSLELEPNDVQVLSNRGTWLYHLESPWAGIADWERAVQIRPDYANGWMKLGTVYREFGQIDRARDAFQTALRVAPADWAHREAVAAEVSAL